MTMIGGNNSTIHSLAHKGTTWILLHICGFYCNRICTSIHHRPRHKYVCKTVSKKRRITCDDALPSNEWTNTAKMKAIAYADLFGAQHTDAYVVFAIVSSIHDSHQSQCSIPIELSCSRLLHLQLQPLLGAHTSSSSFHSVFCSQSRRLWTFFQFTATPVRRSLCLSQCVSVCSLRCWKVYVTAEFWKRERISAQFFV